MSPDEPNLLGQREMERVAGVGYLLGVAGAAGNGHVVRMARPGDQSGMGLVNVCLIVDAAMTGGTGKLVGGIKGHPVMATPAATLDRLTTRRLRCRDRRHRGRRVLVCTATTENQEHDEQQQK
jgi:hypothetical protein